MDRFTPYAEYKYEVVPLPAENLEAAKDHMAKINAKHEEIMAAGKALKILHAELDRLTMEMKPTLIKGTEATHVNRSFGKWQLIKRIPTKPGRDIQPLNRRLY